jgi:hypothetical protein
MLKAVTVSRTYGNLPAYEVLKIADYSHAEASCRNKQKLDDKENLQADIQRLQQRKEMERAPLGIVAIHSPSTTSQLSTQVSVLFPLSLNREEMDSASSKSNASATAST